MRVTERNSHVPSGLTRFLTLHEDCPRGLQIIRDESLVTIVCHGCESSFSYLTKVPPGDPTEVEQALQGLAAEDPEPEEQASPVQEAAAPKPRARSTREAAKAPDRDETPPPKKPEPAEPAAESVWSPPRRLRPPARPPRTSIAKRPSMLMASRGAEDADRAHEPAEPKPPSPARPRSTTKPVRLPPPGPLAPRRREKPQRDPLLPTLLTRIRRTGVRLRGVANAVSQRRRPIAMAALSLAGGYVVIALSTGGEQTSSDTPALGGGNIPLQAAPPGEAETGTVADGARTLESFEGGGPDAAPVTGAGGSFEVTLPPGWEQGSTDEGSDLFQTAGGHARVLVRVEHDKVAGVGELADRGAAFLALRLPAGAKVARIPSRSEGALLAVARATGGDEVQTAYVAEADGAQYLVVSSYDDDASSMERLQAEGIVRSFEPKPSG